MFFNILLYNTGKIILGFFGIHKEEPEEKDPNRVKTLDEVRKSQEVTGFIDKFTPKAKRIGFLFWFVVVIIVIIL